MCGVDPRGAVVAGRSAQQRGLRLLWLLQQLLLPWCHRWRRPDWRSAMLNVQVGLELPQRLLEIQEGLDALWTADDVVGMGTGVLWCITLRMQTQLSTVRCFKRSFHFFIRLSSRVNPETNKSKVSENMPRSTVYRC